MKKIRSFFNLFLTVLILLCHSELNGQSQILTLKGTVYNSNGSVLSGVKVEDENDTQIPRANDTTGSNGKYTINTNAPNPKLKFTKVVNGEQMVLPITVLLSGNQGVKGINVHLENYSSDGVGDLDKDFIISGTINEEHKVQLVFDYDYGPAATGELLLTGKIYKINFLGNRSSLKNAIISDIADAEAKINYPDSGGYELRTNPDDNENPIPEFKKTTWLSTFLPVKVELEGRNQVSGINVVLDPGKSGNYFQKAIKVKGKNKNKTKVEVVMDDSHGPTILGFPG